MDEIFLRDYANNVAMANEPIGVAGILQQPGFENYVPSFSVVDKPQSMINNFMPDGGINFPIKDIATNVLKNQAAKFAARQLGLNTIQSNVLSSILSPASTAFGIAPLLNVNPIGAIQNFNQRIRQTDLGQSKTLMDFLDKKREKKFLGQDDKQGTINTIVSPRITNMQPTDRDIGMGGGSIPTKTSASKSTGKTSNPYSGGPGGVQSGL
jgi:hypothetical protein|tara:strand:+ start:5985 stop:6614 length:630 start_codon:yes stop_codon:yes gene_type:complete